MLSSYGCRRYNPHIAVFLGSCSWRTLQRWTACLPVFMFFFFRGCAVFLGCYSWRTLQRWTAVPACFYVFFSANARSFWGVTAGELCSDGLPCLPVFMFFCANARSFWGATAGELCSDGLPCLPVCILFFRECAVFSGCCSDGLPAFYNLAGVSTATFNEFFWQVHSQHTDLVIT